MSKMSDPTELFKGGNDTSSTEKQPKKIRTSPPIDDEDSPRLLDKHYFTSTTLGSTTTSSTTSISQRAGINSSNSNSNNTNNNHPRHDKDTTEEGLYHKRATKQEKHKKDSQQPSWGTRLRTHPKPVTRFGITSPGSKDKGVSDEELSSGASHDRDSPPPSSPHPSDHESLETLIKHGSGWVCH